MEKVILSTAYCAPVAYYAALFHAKEVWIEAHENYNKQSYRNRMFIASDQGPQSLSINVEKGYAIKSPIQEVRLSDHGDWMHQHLQAWATSYGNTPFYEYYIDDLLDVVLRGGHATLFALNEALRERICQLIGFTPCVHYTSQYYDATDAACCGVGEGLRDLRNVLHPKRPLADALPEFQANAYYQVHCQRQPFMPNLSILDLLFNMGNESILVLRDSMPAD